MSFDFITAITSDGPEQLITGDNFVGLITVLDDFATIAGASTESKQVKGRRNEPLTSSKYVIDVELSCRNLRFKHSSPVVARGKMAVDTLFNLHNLLSRVIDASHLPKDQGLIISSIILAKHELKGHIAWRQLCLPLLTSLSRQSSNAAREIRHNAISHLQRILLGPHIIVDEFHHSQVEEIFNRVVFPLVDDLLKVEVFQRDPQGMSETRLRASALLCKAFMHLDVREDQVKADFRILWIQILDLLDRLMNIDKGDHLVRRITASFPLLIIISVRSCPGIAEECCSSHECCRYSCSAFARA